MQDVRDYVSRLNEAGVEVAQETTVVDSEAAATGMAELPRNFRDIWGAVYVDAGR